MSQPPVEPPVNPLPPVVTALIVVIAGIEAAFQLGARGILGGAGGIAWRRDAWEAYGFFDRGFDRMLALGTVDGDVMLRMVTYPFVHANFTHTLFALVFVAALGKMVGEVYRAWAVLVVFFGATISGAIVYGLVVDEAFPLIGAFPAVYGLIGAFTFLLWTDLVRTGGNPMRAFTLIAVLLGIQLVFGLVFGGRNDWVADLAGFAAGFGLSFVVSPGGWQRVLAKLRRR